MTSADERWGRSLQATFAVQGADAIFAEHAADARLGETVPLVAGDILQFVDIFKMTVGHIDAWLRTARCLRAAMRCL